MNSCTKAILPNEIWGIIGSLVPDDSAMSFLSISKDARENLALETLRGRNELFSSYVQKTEGSFVYRPRIEGLEYAKKVFRQVFQKPKKHVQLSPYFFNRDEIVQTITEISLKNLTNFSDIQLDAIAKRCPRLVHLELYNCKSVTDNGIASISKLSLIQLDVSFCPNITDVGLQTICSIQTLESLSLECCIQLTNTGMQNLRNLSSLEWLNLSCTRIQDLTPLLQMPNLQDLLLDRCYDVSERTLEKLKRLRNLQGMFLGGRFFLGDRYLPQLSKRTRNLCLVDCTLTNRGIFSLRNISRLQTLILSNVHCEFQNLTKIHQIQMLSLTSCRLSAASCTAIFSMNLATIHLINCTLETAEKITQLPKLKRMNLHRTPISAPVFEKILQMKDLDALNVSKCGISKKAVAAARKKYPQINILDSMYDSNFFELFPEMR